jgi:hypothetical protein
MLSDLLLSMHAFKRKLFLSDPNLVAKAWVRPNKEAKNGNGYHTPT